MLQNDNQLKKVLLYGQSEEGKTLIESIIFAQTSPSQLIRFGLDLNDQGTFTLMESFKFKLCRSTKQNIFLEEYITTEKSTIFSNVQVLIYIFDADKEEKLFLHELNLFKINVGLLSEYTPKAPVFVLFHKFEKIKESERKNFFERKHKQIIQRTDGLNIEIKDVFTTSYYDNSLYFALSNIFQSLIPNIDVLQDFLKAFRENCNCDEIALFDESTLLTYGFLEKNEKKDIYKYQSLCNQIQLFKLTLQKNSNSFKEIIVKTEKFTFFFVEFTNNTYIMLVCTDPSIIPGAIQHNIKNTYNLFERMSGSFIDKLKYFLQRKL
ncbi:unnamed protein product [Paramecium sonneborni]|uniref:Uncharacterized protein n=1 Tax=Paramecium sonneborni TaxID=65129 RepID=A0A8S1KDH2_9CILI|nr:unnamed protein product [Paramecium sonneborni]